MATGAAAQRGVGPLGQGGEEAALEAARRPDPGAARLHHRLHATSPTPSPRSRRSRCCASSEPGRAAREAEMRRDGLPRLHDLHGLARLLRTRRCAGSARRRWPRAGPHFKMKVGQDLEDEHAPRRAHARGDRPRGRKLMMDANQCWDVGEAIRQMKALAALRPLVDRGADQPRRRAGPRRHRARRRAHRGGHRRGLPEPRHLQAAPAGGRHRASARSTAAAWAA